MMAMSSLFHEEVVAEPDPDMPRVWGWAFAGVVFCLTFLSICIDVGNSRSSTAAIGYIFAPFISGALAIPGFATGWCTGYFLTWRRSPLDRRRWSAYAAGMVTLLVAGWIVSVLWHGNDLEVQVKRIQGLKGVELEAVMLDPKWNRNKFILGAVAENPEATELALHRIAATDLQELHEKMGSAFAVMGKNDRGLAVMRLVAKHPNTAAADLEILANSKDEQVLGDVAARPELSEATLRRLAVRGGYLVELGLARDPNAPPDILSNLALSSRRWRRARGTRSEAGPWSSSIARWERLWAV